MATMEKYDIFYLTNRTYSETVIN